MKEYLEGYLCKLFQTLMIGAIAAVEEELAEEIGLHQTNKSPQQQILFDKFKKIRSKILDLGNKQQKRTKIELQLYKIKGPYYKYSFNEFNDVSKLKDEKDEGNDSRS